MNEDSAYGQLEAMALPSSAVEPRRSTAMLCYAAIKSEPAPVVSIDDRSISSSVKYMKATS